MISMKAAQLNKKYYCWSLNPKNLLTWLGSLITVFCLLVLFLHYIASYFEPVRWPTKLFFVIPFVLALISRVWSVSFVIFILPLLPELHIQAEFVLHPAVKYFVEFPAVDLIAGLSIGYFCRKQFIEKKSCAFTISLPWPFGLTLVLIMASVSVGIYRNLLRHDETFSWSSLITALTRFKLLNRMDAYYPVADFITFGFCALLLVILLDFFKKVTNKDAFVFIPVAFGLIGSAGWGILQAATSFGLTSKTADYRMEILGFGAQGFQPDLHAFAAHMLIGTIGCLGYLKFANSTRDRRVVMMAWLLCWTGLILSKSRAALFFSMGANILLICWLSAVATNLKVSARVILVIFFSCAVGFAVVTGNLDWISQTAKTIAASPVIDYSTYNELSRYRLDIQGSALRMGLNWPLFGVGQGLFYPLSALQEFSQSAYLVSRGGENAHNYFLQTFVELGLIGLSTFFIIFIYPVTQIKSPKVLTPAVIAILSIFLGNLYSHPLLNRENLYLLTVFVALLYSHLNNNYRTHESANDFFNQNRVVVLLKLLPLICICILIYLAIVEVKESFLQFPFKQIK